MYDVIHFVIRCNISHELLPNKDQFTRFLQFKNLQLNVLIFGENCAFHPILCNFLCAFCEFCFVFWDEFFIFLTKFPSAKFLAKFSQSNTLKLVKKKIYEKFFKWSKHKIACQYFLNFTNSWGFLCF